MFPKLETPSLDVANLQKSFVTNRRYEFQSECVKSVFRRTNKAQKDQYNRLRLKMSNFLKYEDYMNVNHRRSPKVLSVTPYADVLLEVQLFTTIPHSESWAPRQCNQMIQVLGSQPLTALAERIRCINNYIDTAGDVSDCLTAPATTTLEDVITSSMFYLGNSFYVHGEKDYSKIVKAWAKRKKLDLGETYQMSNTCFKDLKVRLNYPYVYQHLGSCEHTVVFTEARFLDDSDESITTFYPIVRDLEDPNFHKCYICGKFFARWIVRGTERLVFDVNTLCDDCFKKYNYVNGKKIGDFQAYRILLDKK